MKNTPTALRTLISSLKMPVCLLTLLCLNGCAALAVSLAGAGAGAGLSHQMTGTATRTFSEPLSKVDNAMQLATRKMMLEVDEVNSTLNGQQTRARVGELKITIGLETLSGNLTRVDVEARKDFFRLDYATAQEIVVQIERILENMNIAAAEAEAEASRRGALNEAKYKAPVPQTNTPGRKTSSTAKRRDSI